MPVVGVLFLLLMSDCFQRIFLSGLGPVIWRNFKNIYRLELERDIYRSYNIKLAIQECENAYESIVKAKGR